MATRQKTQTKKQLAGQQYDLIRIESKRSDEEMDVVAVQVNGYKFAMQREQLIPVPSYVVEVLQNARTKKFDHKTVIDGRPREYYLTRFPFSVIYTDIKVDAYEALRGIAQKRPITQEDVDAALNPPEQPDG